MKGSFTLQINLRFTDFMINTREIEQLLIPQLKRQTSDTLQFNIYWFTAEDDEPYIHICLSGDDIQLQDIEKIRGKISYQRRKIKYHFIQWENHPYPTFQPSRPPVRTGRFECLR